MAAHSVGGKHRQNLGSLMTAKPDDAPSATELADFETSLDELETLVEQMESGDLTLEESLKAFERGVALTRSCQNALKSAELRVQQLTSAGATDVASGEQEDDAE